MLVFRTSSGRRGVSVSRERQSAGGFLKILACSLLLPNQQNETVRGFCAYQSNTRRLRREGMGVWTFDGFVCRRNSKAILTGRDESRVFEIRRGYRAKGQWRESVRYGVSSLPATIALAFARPLVETRTLGNRKPLALRQRCHDGRRSEHHSYRQWTQNHGRFTQYRHQFASPSRIFHHCGSHALQ